MNTLKYVGKRLVFMLLTFFIIISACFILIRLLPNETATMFGKDMQLVLQSRYRQGLTDINGNPIPLMTQYWNFVTKTLIGGNWGLSEKLYFGQDCFQIFLEKLPNTVLVNMYSSLFAVPMGLILGIYAALKKNRWQDHLISTGVMIMVSVPSYVYAFLVQYILCFKMKLFPLVMEALKWKMEWWNVMVFSLQKHPHHPKVLYLVCRQMVRTSSWTEVWRQICQVFMQLVTALVLLSRLRKQ